MNALLAARARLLRAHPARRGTVIVPALLIVMLTATLSMIYLQVSLAKNKEQRVSVDSKRAFYMAEAGLAEAFSGLCAGKSGDVGTEDLPAEYANGLFFVVATDEGQGRITLRSTGLCGAGRATLSIVVQRQPDDIAARGFFGDSGVTVQSGALIDSFDSRLGSYQKPNLLAILAGLLTTGARVGCNSDINVQGSLLSGTYVLGDVHPGESGTLFRSTGTTITGSTAPASANASMPGVVVPTYDSQGDVLAVKKKVEIKQGEQGFGTIHVDKDGELKITGPAIIVADSMTIDGKIEFDAKKGPIKIFLKNGLDVSSLAQVRTDGTDPLGLSIAVAGTTPTDLDGDGVVDPLVTLDGSGSYFGTVYAPHADITLKSSLEMFGGVTGESLTVANGAKLHYDRALSESSGDTTGPPKFLAWRVVELPEVPLVSLRFDAVKELKKSGKTPPKARNAHWKIGELFH